MREATRQSIVEDWIRAFSISPLSTKKSTQRFDSLIKQFGLEELAKVVDHYSTPERGNPGRLWGIKDPFSFVAYTIQKGSYKSKKLFKYP